MPDTNDETMKPMQNAYFMTETIPKFNGEDLTYSSAKWSQDIEDNAEIFSWTPQQTLIIARKSLTGTAELWLKTEKAFKTYEELKAALVKEFPDTLNSKEMHETMSARKKKPSETCYQYMLIMKELGKRAKFPDYVSIEYIVDGIPDSQVNKMSLYGVTTYTALKDKLTIYETMKQKMKPRLDNTQSENSRNENTKNSQSQQRCFKCGELGHLASVCSSGIKCFRCNAFGHIGVECKAGGGKDGVTATASTSTSRNVGTTGGSGTGARVRRSMFAENQCSVDSIEGAVSGNECQCQRYAERNAQRNEMSQVSSIIQCDTDSYQNENSQVFSVNSDGSLNKSVKDVKIANFEVKCLVDTGSDLNLVSSDLVTDLNIRCYEREEMTLAGLGSSKVHAIGKFNYDLVMDGHCYDVCFYIVPKGVMPYPVILGQPFIANTVILIDKGTVEVRPRSTDDPNWWCLFAIDDCEEENPLVQELRASYRPTKLKEAPIKLKIVLTDDIPVVQRPRRLALKEEEVVRQQIKEWLSKGVIRPSYSEYASPLVLVRKKDGSTRVCVDYRKINQKMVKDEYPLPVIDDHIDKLSKARVFSTLDLKNGFFHLPIEEDSIKYTAFVTSNPEGQYEFLRAPFGLSICPKYFMRYINIIFREFIMEGTVLIFIDDLIILAEDEVQGLERLKKVLRVAEEYGLEINWRKTQLLQQSVEYLGHIITNGTVRPSKEKTQAVLEFPEPTTLKEVHSFIGLTSYFRKFIPDYALVARPLSEMLKTGEFLFEADQKRAFEKLKGILCCDPVLKIFDTQLETELHTDASKLGYAAILLQKDPIDGSMHPVHYMSRKTTEAQQKCSSYELEAIAVIEGVKKFRKYLIGIPFKIVTDCEAFQKTLTKKEVCAKVARWIMFLQDFDFTIIHRSGEQMRHVDSLSRNICFISTELHARIQRAQEEDEGLKVIREILKDKSYEDYILDNGVIYKGIEKKLVIPEIMDEEMIRRTHGVGHFGKKKIMSILEKDYYISKLDSKIDKVISMCIPCILASRKSGKKEGLLNPIDKGEMPLTTLHCDHLGPLDATKKMYNYILTIIDAYTKFVWIYPVKSVTAKETVEKFRLHQKDYGNPCRIVTDRGTAFTGKEFAEYCEEEGIEHVRVTTGIPRGNGQVERINRIIISVLTKMCVEEPGHWYKYVSKLQRAINSTHQRSINTSPFELLTGTTLRLKEELKLVDLLEEENRNEFIERREELRRQAKVQLLKIQEENRKTYNKKRRAGQSYQEGDLVAIQRTQFGSGLKLKQKFFGPYRIVKKLVRDRYEVEKIDHSKEGPKKTTTTVDHMKRWA